MRYLSIIIILFLAACSSKPQGYRVDSYYHYYINDSLKISVAFSGSEVHPVPKNKHFQKKILKQYELPYNQNLSLLAYTKPWRYSEYGFYDFLFLVTGNSNKLIAHDNMLAYVEKDRNFYLDSLQITLFEPESSYGRTYYIDTAKMISYYPFSDSNNHFLFVTIQKTRTDPVFDLQILNGHSVGNIARISTGKDYARNLTYSNPWGIAEDDFWYPSGGNYLGAITALEKLIPEVTKTPYINDYYVTLSQYYGMSNNIDSAMYYYYKPGSITKTLSEKDRAYLNTIKTDATPVILDSIQNYDIIAINENHANAASRYYAAYLLPKLKKAGFTNLGMEALASDNTDSLRAMVYSNGFYTLGTAFTCLTNTALSLNMRIFKYEDTLSGPKTFEQRDERQATNIVNQLSKIDSGKTILYCGFAHLSKAPNLKTMVQFLQQKLNKKVLSIDMESLTTAFPDEFLSDTFPLLFPDDSKSNSILPNRYQADLQVLIPGNSIIPIQKAMGFQEIKINLPDSIINNPKRKAMYIYKRPYIDPAQNQPLYIDLSKLQKQSTVYLQKGEYILHVVDDRLNVLYAEDVAVE